MINSPPTGDRIVTTFRQAFTFSIQVIRCRWREVLWLLLLDFVRELRFVLPKDHSRDLAGSSFIFTFIGFFLWAGFLRLTVTRGTERQSFRDLFQTGGKFLGRLFTFGFLISLPVASFFVLHLVAIKQGWLPQMHRSTLLLVVTAPYCVYFLILLKPVLCIPSVVLVEDCPLREAWRQMPNIRLRRMPGVVLWLLVNQLLVVFFVRVIKPEDASLLQSLLLMLILLVLSLSGYLLSLIIIQLIGTQLNPSATADSSAFQARLKRIAK